MEKNYAEKGGENEIVIHCDMVIAERIYEGICSIFAEYPNKAPDDIRSEKRKLARLKGQIEGLLPRT
jgi:hypothetical protein